MIRINLKPKNRDRTVLSTMGLNLSKVNIKFILVAVVISYGLKIPIAIYLQRVEGKESAKIEVLNKKEKVLVGKVSKYKDIEKQIKEIIDEEEKLRGRKKIIKDRLENRKNPLRIMVYIAKNIPDNLWIESMRLTENKIDIEGVTSTYKSIGLFIDNLKNSVYFDKTLSFDGAETQIDKKTGARLEKFKISGKVVGYN